MSYLNYLLLPLAGCGRLCLKSEMVTRHDRICLVTSHDRICLMIPSRGAHLAIRRCNLT
jgi:hypothetical protein